MTITAYRPRLTSVTATMLVLVTGSATLAANCTPPQGTPPQGLFTQCLQDVGDADWAYVRSEAESQATTGNTPRYHSTTECEYLSFKGSLVFEPRADQGEPNQLAVFSDDGCRVYVNGTQTDLVIDGQSHADRYGVGQHLPNRKQSLARVDFQFQPNVAYEIEVWYSNIMYSGNDLDGLTLFVFNGGGTAVDEPDLDVDSNMDGNVDNDDAKETDKRAVIVRVNNDSDRAGADIDNQNGAIDGAADKAELTKLVIRKYADLAAGWKIVLKVDDKAKLRIFDDGDTAVIGPAAADGGPDSDEHEVPRAKITAADLTYLVEGFDHGHVIAKVEVRKPDGTAVQDDSVRLVVNVDRKPGDAYQTVRNYVRVLKARAKLEGTEAKLEGGKPLIDWGKPRNTKTTSFWVGVQKNDVSKWIQTGVRTIKSTTGADSEEHYFEFVPNYTDYASGADPLGYQIFTKGGGSWTSGKFTVEITDRTTGKAEASFDGTSWKSQTHNAFKTATFENYQLNCEPKQSIARVPGTAASHGKISLARYKDDTGWHNTSFVASDVKLKAWDGKGNLTAKDATAAGVELLEHNAKFIDGRTFEIWDSRDW